MRILASVLAFGLLAAAAEAHVTVAPRESTLGRNQVYTVRVPAEGGRATSQTVLQIPDGVTVSRVKAVPGLKFDVKRKDDRIVQITWTMDVHPGSYAEFQFIARNPEAGTDLTWKARALHPDGTSTDWVNPRGEPRPASVTSLVAAAD
jgi:uncharacterized protein YcnI